MSVGPFVSETDEAEREREKHETRRLLYVALTRARDRLYLSSVLKDGVLQPGPRQPGGSAARLDQGSCSAARRGVRPRLPLLFMGGSGPTLRLAGLPRSRRRC